tara:strand:+ start:2584 stop:5265 length:2682 start_codon:yes stop_codon:yes gene_type:complete
MDEKFATLLERGVKSLGDRREQREYLNSLKENPDGQLLIDYLEQKDVGEIATEDNRDDFKTSLLVRDTLDNKIKLQPFITVRGSSSAGNQIASRLQQKYPGFNSIPVDARTKMVEKLVENYGVKMTSAARRRVETPISEARELKRHLSNFVNRNTGKELTSAILRKPKIDTKNIMLDSESTKADRESALAFLSNHSERLKLNPLITMLESSMNLGERIVQPNFLLQDFIAKGDLRLTKNRRKIYDYWESISPKYEALVKAHNDFKEVLNAAFPKDERDNPENVELKDSELYDVIDKFNEFDNEKIKQLEYVFKFGPVDYSTIDSDDKGIEALDEFLDRYKLLSERSTAPSPKARQRSGYRRTEEQGGGQVGIMEAGDSGSEILQEETRIMRLRDLIEDNIIDTKLDPLFAYAYKQGKAGFRVTPAMAQDFRRMKNRMKKYAIRLRLNKEALRQVERFMNDIEMQAVISEGDFFLPYQEELIDEIYGGFKDDGKYIEPDSKTDTRIIKDYLDTISSFIQAGQEVERGTGIGISTTKVVEAVSGKKDKLGRKQRQQIGSGRGVSLPSKRSMRSQLGSLDTSGTIFREVEVEEGGEKKKVMKPKKVQLKPLFNDLLKAINEYYVDPATSSLKPLARRFDWMDTTTLGILGSRRVKGNAFLTMLSLQRSNSGGILLDEPNMESVVNILSALAKPVTKNSAGSFLDLLEDAAGAVDEVFKGDDSRGVSIEFGNLGFETLKKNGLDTDKNFSGKKLSEWHKIYNESPGVIYPFGALYYHVLSNETLYTKYSTKYESLISEIKRIENKLDIVKSDLEVNYLNAHDTVRKMMQKPIYYGLSSTDDFDDVQETISIMKSEFNTDLTAMEIESIVKELDSMENLSRKYGISTEGVYYLKATHR